MVSRKYTKDYRLEPYLDRKGRLRDRAVYCGLYYTFCEDRGKVRKAAWQLTALNAIATLSVVLPMCFRCDYFRQFYLVLPQAFLFLPLYFLWAAIYRVFTAEEKVTQEHRDKIMNRLPTAGVFLLIFSGVSVVGTVVYAVIGILRGADWFAAACAVIRLVPAVLIFRLRGKLRLEDIPIPPSSPEKNS